MSVWVALGKRGGREQDCTLAARTSEAPTLCKPHVDLLIGLNQERMGGQMAGPVEARVGRSTRECQGGEFRSEYLQSGEEGR